VADRAALEAANMVLEGRASRASAASAAQRAQLASLATELAAANAAVCCHDLIFQKRTTCIIICQ
jgi:hypothetical protein